MRSSVKFWSCLAAALLLACGNDAAAPSGGAARGDSPANPVVSQGDALVLTPRVEVVGLGDVFDTLEVIRLTMFADIFVLPVDLDQGDGDAVGVRFDFEAGAAHTKTLQRGLELQQPGRYRVLLRVRPDVDGVSVDLQGRVAPEEVLTRGKADEPAPSPAEPAPSPADEADEPAPSPADEADEPAPSPARNKPGAELATGFPEPAREVDVSLHRAYEFYAGTVEVTAGDKELVVTWDVRGWLRLAMADSLGLDAPEPETFAPVPADDVPGGMPADFRIDAR